MLLCNQDLGKANKTIPGQYITSQTLFFLHHYLVSLHKYIRYLKFTNACDDFKLWNEPELINIEITVAIDIFGTIKIAKALLKEYFSIFAYDEKLQF